MLPFALLLGLLFQQVPQQPVPPDTAATTVGDAIDAASDEAADVADEVAGLSIRPIFSAGALYSSSRGIGIGGGFAASNVATSGDHLQVEGRVGQRVQGAFGSYMTGEPERAALYGVLAGSVVTSSRFPFQGTGPRSNPDGRLYLDRVESEIEARLGWQPLGVGGPLVQPLARFRVDRLRGFEGVAEGDSALVTAADLDEVSRLRDQTRRVVAVGLSALSDSRDNEAVPTRGAYVQGAAERYFAVDGSGLGFNQAEFLGYLFRPSPIRFPFQRDKGAVFVRVSAMVTREDSGDTLPFYYIPIHDRDRLVGWPARSFAGRDALSVGVGARGAVFHRPGVFRVEGIGLAMLGATYDNLFDDIALRVSSSNAPVAVGDDVPFRPSLGLGLNIHYRDKERPLVGALLGVGPGGITLTSFRLVIGLDRYRPEVR